MNPACASPSDSVILAKLDQCVSQITCGADPWTRDAPFLQAVLDCESQNAVSPSCARTLAGLQMVLGPCTPGTNDVCVPFDLLCTQSPATGSFSCREPNGAPCDSNAPDVCTQFGLLCLQDADAGAQCAYPQGAPCTAGLSDRCAPVGYSCQPFDAGFACLLPSGVSDPCFASVGCGGFSLDCTRVFGSPLDPDGGRFACRWDECTNTSECTGLDNSCDNMNLACVANACGPVSTANPSVYFGVCNAETDAGDGQCLPSVPYSSVGGHCFETGPAALGDPCYPTRSDAGPYCAAGGFCFSGATSAQCLQVCSNDSYDAGPAPCPTATVCFAGFIPSQDWGVCVSSCATGDCPSGQTCTLVADGGAAVCLPN
jgi:hypothetical protein